MVWKSDMYCDPPKGPENLTALESSKNTSSKLYCKFTEDLNAQDKTLESMT